MTKILITPRSLTRHGLDRAPELQSLRERFELVGGPAGMTPDTEQLVMLVPGCVGWLAGVEAITAPVLEAATTLKIISRNGVGTDAIDLAAAARLDITVVTAPGSNAQSVAELALALALAALRNVPWSSAALVRGEWCRWEGRELADCIVGVVGLGAVGRRTAATFNALGATVIGSDPAPGDTTVELVTLAELTRRSDIVSLHCPATPDGSPLISADLLRKTKPGVIVINTARSSLVDDDALLAGLRSGHVGGYAIDAFDFEPPRVNDLLRHPRVIATPHLGAFTTTSVRNATQMAVDNLLAALEAL
jgi:D-3-phosphoglycerate dehydrogenase / 2-oxoglutarate reductase